MFNSKSLCCIELDMPFHTEVGVVFINGWCVIYFGVHVDSTLFYFIHVHALCDWSIIHCTGTLSKSSGVSHDNSV